MMPYSPPRLLEDNDEMHLGVGLIMTPCRALPGRRRPSTRSLRAHDWSLLLGVRKHARIRDPAGPDAPRDAQQSRRARQLVVCRRRLAKNMLLVGMGGAIVKEIHIL